MCIDIKFILIKDHEGQHNLGISVNKIRFTCLYVCIDTLYLENSKTAASNELKFNVVDIT